MEQQEAAPNMAALGAEAAVQAREQAAEHPAEHPLLEGAIARVQAGLDAKVQEIRDDRRLTKEEQREQISDIWGRLSADYPKVLENYERVLEEDAEKELHKLFYVIPSNRDSVRSAYSDVYNRTELAWSSGDMEGIQHAHEELERLWERAVRTGDRNLQVAVGHVAAERGVHELRDKWLATSKEKSAAWERYGEARKKLDHWKDPRARLNTQLTRPISLIKPEEA